MYLKRIQRMLVSIQKKALNILTTYFRIMHQIMLTSLPSEVFAWPVEANVSQEHTACTFRTEDGGSISSETLYLPTV
jgi:hypothetical protein